MPLRFLDADGNEGRITDDLTLTYDGSAETGDAIEAFIDELEANGLSGEERIETLILDLPRRCPIRRIERTQVPNRLGR